MTGRTFLLLWLACTVLCVISIEVAAVLCGIGLFAIFCRLTYAVVMALLRWIGPLKDDELW